MRSVSGTIRYTCGMHGGRPYKRTPFAAWIRPAGRGPVPLAPLMALVLACTAGAGCSGTKLPHPDVLLVTLAALPIESLACHGGRAEVGTGLCSVGDEGSRFVWAFTAASSPVPTVATLLTGLTPDQHGVTTSAASFLESGISSIAEHAADAGYATAAFVVDPALNRSRHLDQGFARFDDGPVRPGPGSADAAPTDLAARAAQWLASAPTPFFAWVHLDAHVRPGAAGDAALSKAEALRLVDRDLSRLLAVLDARPTPPAILVTTLPEATANAEGLSPATTRMALLWRPPRVGGGRGVGRVIRTPVSQLDVGPTLLRAIGLVGPTTGLPGRPLPFRERRAGEAGRTLEIAGVGERGLVGEGVFLVVGDGGEARGVAQLPLAGERSPALGPPDRADELVSRLWAEPEGS